MLTLSLTREDIASLKKHEKEALAILIEWHMNEDGRKIPGAVAWKTAQTPRNMHVVGEIEDIPF